MPKNTLKFWKNLRREKLNGTNCLRSLRFAIFGLGDSSYVKCVSRLSLGFPQETMRCHPHTLLLHTQGTLGFARGYAANRCSVAQI